MSSGTIVQPYAARQVAGAASDKVMDRIKALGLSPRQLELNELWAWYRCQNYDARRIDWDGKQRTVGLDREVIASAGYIPPGFYDAAGSASPLPLKFRRPSSPYALAKVIVDRFTGLLFSERRHPQIRCEGDDDTEDFMAALAEAGRLWPMMILARTYGGAMGSVALGFQFVNGKPVFEVHDPRWIIPDFKDRLELKLRSIEKRYQYPVEKKDEQGRWVETPYWYRRTIDENSDVLFEPVEVPEDGSEPDWKEQARVDHQLGFCPVVWIQNLPVQDSVDGDPDCHGIYDVIESIDTLISQGNRGIIANCDPTTVISSDAQMSEVAKGSSNAIKVPAGSTVTYLELQGSGPKTAFEAADKLRAYALEVAQCVLDHPDVANRTATEIERVYSSMLAKADILREQYGQRGVLVVMDMAVQAARKLVPRSSNGSIQRQTIVLPPRLEPQENGEPPKPVPRKLGPGNASVELQWGAYFPPSLADTAAAVTAAAKAKDSGLIDREHAANFVASDFRVEKVPEMLAKIEKEKQEEQARVEQSFMPPGGGWGQEQ